MCIDMNLHLLIVAAGESSRMGMPKPLVSVFGKTFLDHILLNPFVRNFPNPPILVIGHRAHEIQATISETVTVVINDEYQQGRTTSIKKGLQALPASCDGVFILPIDCPFVPGEVFVSLQDAFTGPESICIPSIQNRRGHPPLIGSSFFDTIYALRGDQSLRDLYKEKHAYIQHIDVQSREILTNINTPEELERYRNQNPRKEH
jgi:molybdenum cofactor cytidylyltransferase